MLMKEACVRKSLRAYFTGNSIIYHLLRVQDDEIALIDVTLSLCGFFKI